MDIPENVPIRAASWSNTSPEFIGGFGFHVVSASLSAEFGDEKYSRKVGDRFEHNSSRAIYCVVEYDMDSGPRGGVTVGGTLSEGGFSVTGGSRLRDIFGRCTILTRRDDPDRKYSVGGIYFLSAYDPKDPLIGSPTPDSYALQVHLPEPLFDDIVGNLRSGKLPKITVSVRDLHLVTEFEYYWDTKKVPVLPIHDFHVNFVTMVDYALRKEHRPFTVPEEQLYFPPNKADLGLLLQAINNQSVQMMQLVGKLQWLIYGVIVIAGLSILRLLLR